MRIIEVVLKDQLRETVMGLAADLKKLNPNVLRVAKDAFKHAITMDYDQAYDYLVAKNDQLRYLDQE